MLSVNKYLKWYGLECKVIVYALIELYFVTSSLFKLRIVILIDAEITDDRTPLKSQLA